MAGYDKIGREETKGARCFGKEEAMDRKVTMEVIAGELGGSPNLRFPRR